MRRKQCILPLILLLLTIFQCIPAPGAPIPAGLAGEEARMTVYFPNWNVYSDSAAQVKNLPWDRIDCVNHAFWKVAPKSGGFALVSTDPTADTGSANAHFPQYQKMAAAHPGKDILLSIGGWTCCGYFSEMCLTRESRSSFIQSCVSFLEDYPFFTGLDIDWEYPGVPRKGSGSDEGNPSLGDDKTNYTLLLQELRAALDQRFGKNAKRLTVCAAASKDVLSHQDYAALHPYVDRINLMTYDMAGIADAITGHQAALYGEPSADSAVKYLLSQGVPRHKIAIGAPFYSHGWKQVDLSSGDPLGAKGKGFSGGTRLWKDLVKLEKAAVDESAPGWHKSYDEAAQAAYLWNDDPASRDYRVFLTYDSTKSLDAKTAYIRDQGLGGLIVWQSGGDDATADYPMLTRAYRALHP